MAYGLLIDYQFCSGCGSCVVACKEEHGYPVGQWGIRLYEDGPWQVDEHNWNWNKVPVPTKLCDFCKDRVAEGREPSCVHHCLADVMTFGTVEELAAKLAERPGQVLWSETCK